MRPCCETVARNYPGHRIAGAYSPPFRPLTPAEEAEIVERINAARPDVLWVALGMPKQDIWIHERLNSSTCLSPSASAQPSPLSPAPSPRCPEWMGRAGFEWVYRFWKEPGKLWRRDLLDGPRFIFHAGMEFIRKSLRMPEQPPPRSDARGVAVARCGESACQGEARRHCCSPAARNRRGSRRLRPGNRQQPAAAASYLRYWSVAVYGEWMALYSVVMYFSNLDFGVTAAAINAATMAYARDDWAVVQAHTRNRLGYLSAYRGNRRRVGQSRSLFSTFA